MPQPNELNYTDTFTVLNGDGELAVAATVNAAIGSVTLNWKTSATGAITSTALTALTAGTDVHTDNRAYMLGPGVLRVDFPDSPWASGASKVWAWLTFSGGLAGYEQAGGQRVFTLGYGLQNPDSGATELAREATVDAVATDVDEILTDTGTTLPATLTTIGSNASTAATQSTTAATQATTAATQATTAATQSTTAATQSTAAAASAAAVQAKLPSASAKIAGEGANAKNLDQVTVPATEVLLETITDGTMPDSTTVRIDDTNDRSNLVGYQIAIGTYLRTITGYTAYVDEPETPASFSIDIAISPSVVNGTLVQVFSRSTGSVVLTEENIEDIADAVAAQVTVGTVTPTAERPANPARQRKVRRSQDDGLVFDKIVLRIGDEDAAWWLDFSSDLQAGLGIAVTEGAISTPIFSPSSGLAVVATRTGDRPTKGILLEFNPTTIGTYTMTIEVTYEGQGTHTVQGPVEIVAGA